jgi:hypothetical protein
MYKMWRKCDVYDDDVDDDVDNDLVCISSYMGDIDVD